jgi:DNA-binding NarL/FixJ family response regulator
MDAITVVAVDDHPLIHEAIRSLLDRHEEIELVASGTAGEHVLSLVRQYRPDVLLLDLSMPQHVGPEETPRFSAPATLSQLQALYPETAVIILSQYLRPTLVKEIMQHNVRGYILKSDNFSLSIPRAILSVKKGEVYFSPQFNQTLPSRVKRYEDPLTPRQKEIILAIARSPGMPYAELASMLFISESTFKGHLTHAFKALEVNNITACIMHCISQELIPYEITSQGISFPILTQ